MRMFRQAVATAAAFTHPILVSFKQVNGGCGSSIGTFVTLNDEGWILTAAHIVTDLIDKIDAEQTTQGRPAEVARVNGDTSLTAKERYDQTKALGKAQPSDIERCSAWWGGVGDSLVDVTLYPEIDLAIARLTNFRAGDVMGYPTIKDPTKDVEPGVSLCKLGFPFHSIIPTWDDAAQTFHLPPEALPMPRFPIEGMFTRTLELSVPGSTIPMVLIETSSPGLRGQSGGPTFDSSGTVWAIQSKTMNLPLGFDPQVPNGGGRREHQFLNVGAGVHPATICGALDSLGVKYDKSAY